MFVLQRQWYLKWLRWWAGLQELMKWRHRTGLQAAFTPTTVHFHFLFHPMRFPTLRQFRLGFLKWDFYRQYAFPVKNRQHQSNNGKQTTPSPLRPPSSPFWRLHAMWTTRGGRGKTKVELANQPSWAWVSQFYIVFIPLSVLDENLWGTDFYGQVPLSLNQPTVSQHSSQPVAWPHPFFIHLLSWKNGHCSLYAGSPTPESRKIQWKQDVVTLLARHGVSAARPPGLPARRQCYRRRQTPTSKTILVH